MSGILKTIGVFFILIIFTVAAALFLGSFYYEDAGNVALIQITGEITTQPSFLTVSTSSSAVVDYIEKADTNPMVEAILFEIDSPGGTIVSTREIANAVKSTEKTTVCWLRESAASGAYWIASNCDKIVADPYTLTGSIGVTGSYIEFSGLFEKYGINYVRVVSGESKDVGSPFREPTDAELAQLKEIVNEVQGAFIAEVSTNRNLNQAQVQQLSAGGVLLGKDAQEIGLVDVLGGKKEAEELIVNMTNITDVQYKEYRTEISFFDLAAGVFGKSMARQFLESELTLEAR